MCLPTCVSYHVLVKLCLISVIYMLRSKLFFKLQWIWNPIFTFSFISTAKNYTMEDLNI